MASAAARTVVVSGEREDDTASTIAMTSAPPQCAPRSSAVSCCVMPFAQRRGWLERLAPALLLLAAVAAIAWGMVTIERIRAESHARYLASAPLGGWER